MIEKTEGIVLHQLKYGESSLVVSMYTKDFGRLSFMVNGTKGKKAKFRSSLFMPLTILELDIYYKKTRELQRISEARIHVPYKSLQSSILKSTVSLFLAEILYKTLQEQEPNFPLYDFLWHSLQYFDLLEKRFSDFHLVFLTNFSRFLGFSANVENQKVVSSYFDLKNGIFKVNQPKHPLFVKGEITEKLFQLFQTSVTEASELNLSGKERRALLELIVDYYRIHIESLGTINSLEVLKEVFN